MNDSQTTTESTTTANSGTSASPEKPTRSATPADHTHALLKAADGGPADLATAVDRIGLRTTAATLISEILFRAHLDDLTATEDDASVVITLTHGGEQTSALISVGPQGVGVGRHAIPTGLPAVRIVQDAAAAAAALYGPRERASSTGREIRWPSPHTMVPRLVGGPPVPRLFHAVVQRVIQVLDREQPHHLTDLAVHHGTDKWSFLHQYTPHYERHFGPLREHRVTVLEIGVGGYDDPRAGGGSLHMWKEFFPRGLVYGMDIADKSALDRPRVTTVQADQSDPGALRAVAERHGPFDIVIDDGSHMSPHVITAFHTLFSYLKEGGIYAIEDLHGSYWPQLFGGSEEDLNDSRYTVGHLKELVDGLNHEEFIKPGSRTPRPTDTAVKGLHFYHNLAFIEKGRNEEGSPLATVLREAPERLGAEGAHP